MVKVLKLEDRHPQDAQDIAALDAIAGLVDRIQGVPLADVVERVSSFWHGYKVGCSGSHVWISKCVPEGWHRIGMITERQYLSLEDLTAKMVRSAGGNEVSVLVGGTVFTVRKVGCWYVVRDTKADRAVKWTSIGLAYTYLADFTKDGF
jgi:hypothetical protein